METKICHGCGEAKSRDHFYRQSRSKDGLAARCKPCWSERAKTYWQKNEGARRAEARAIRKAEAPAKRAAWRKQWLEENKEKWNAQVKAWREANCEREAVRLRQWAIDHRDRRAANEAKRRAAKSRATPGWADLTKIAEFYAEAQKLTRETGVEHHVDHIVPIQSELVCGFHCERNLEIMVGTENQAKFNTFWPDMP